VISSSRSRHVISSSRFARRNRRKKRWNQPPSVPVVDETLATTIDYLIDSVLPHGAVVCSPIHFSSLSLYRGRLNLSCRVQLHQCTTAELHQYLQAATIELAPGLTPSIPSHIRFSASLFAKACVPQCSFITPDSTTADFFIIGNRASVEREIGTNVLRMSREGVGGGGGFVTRRRILITNAASYASGRP
jgi:hypothetical protein